MDHTEAVAVAQHSVAEKAVAQPHEQPNYLAVFIALAVITAIITTVELMSGSLGIPRVFLNSFYVAMAVAKATLVAMYYMHLKQDSRLYTALFVTPALFALVFIIMLAVQ
jgi:cytochrome c oxidase subunit 4